MVKITIDKEKARKTFGNIAKASEGVLGSVSAGQMSRRMDVGLDQKPPQKQEQAKPEESDVWKEIRDLKAELRDIREENRDLRRRIGRLEDRR